MSSQATLPTDSHTSEPGSGQPYARSRKTAPAPLPLRFPAHFGMEDVPQRQAELFTCKSRSNRRHPW